MLYCFQQAAPAALVPLLSCPVNYYLQSMNRGRWYEMTDGAQHPTVAKTEAEASEMLKAWQRSLPSMSFRYVKR